jgi:hypothetical protein
VTALDTASSITLANPSAAQAALVSLSSLTSASLTTTTSGTASLTRMVWVSFDQGWSLTSGATVKVTSAGNALALTILSSSDPNFKYVSAYAASVVYTNAATVPVIVTNAVTPWLVYTYSNLYFTISATGDFADLATAAACEVTSNSRLPITAAVMTASSYSPLTSEGFGVNVQKTDLKIVLTLPAAVYPGSTFSIVVNSNFAATGCTWTLTAGTLSLTGTAGSNTITTTSADLTAKIASATSVTITVSGVILPVISNAATPWAGFDSVTISTGSNSVAGTPPSANAYITYTDSVSGSASTTRTTFSIGATTVGTTTISTLKTFPTYKGAKYVRFQMKFKPSIAVPAGSKLTITGETFSADTSLRFNTWISCGFTDVTLGSTSITLTIASAIAAGAVVEFRKDRAFDISASATPAAWLVTATWGSTNLAIITDTATTNKLTFTTAPTPAISNAAVKVAIDNKGFDAFHKFTFVPGVALSSSTLVAFDAPVDYDAHVGSYVTFSALPSYYWLAVYSSVASAIYCSVDHWLIVCGGFSNISALLLSM